MPGMSASVSSSILVMENPSPTFSRVTFAPVWTRVGARPARESCAVSAIVKHPAWAAPISSSGLVAAWPSSNRDLNEYGPSKAPLPTLSRPLPSARLPFHSASAFRVGMEPPFALPPFSVSLFDALLDLLGRVPAINGDYLAGDERCAVGTEPDDGARDLFRPADASDRMRGLQHLPHFRRGREVAKHSRRDRPWSHGIDPNILFGVFERDRFGQPGDGVLAGGVERRRGKPDQPRNGRVVDDRTAARLQHRGNLVLERQPDALYVDVHDLVVRLFGLIRQRSQRLLDAGVVEGKIEPAETRQRPSDHRLDIALFRDVGLDEDRFAARRFDLGDDGIAFCLAASADDDLRALFGKRDCGRTANPSIAAGDQGDFPRKLTHAVLHRSSFPQLSCRPARAAGRRIWRTARRSVGTGADLSAERCGAGRPEIPLPFPSRPRPSLLSVGGIGSLAAASGDAATRASAPSSGALARATAEAPPRPPGAGVRAIGGTRTIKVDVRPVAATNRDLVRMVEEHRFRDDLYYRLNVFPIHAPPLRERPEDIEPLVRYFVQRFAARMQRRIEVIPTETLDAMRRYPWPGNVRELENLIERAVILSSGPRLTVPLAHLARRSTPAAQGGSASTLEGVERAHTTRVLEETNWMLGGPRGAAARLGMKRTTLQSLMKLLAIARPA